MGAMSLVNVTDGCSAACSAFNATGVTAQTAATTSPAPRRNLNVMLSLLLNLVHPTLLPDRIAAQILLEPGSSIHRIIEFLRTGRSARISAMTRGTYSSASSDH